ncbi:MAG: tandem-95 repeat protein, partial [Acidobacteria bacterium]|nr:tandem-95 repeat protein [Acidobacteriota bacterium]
PFPTLANDKVILPRPISERGKITLSLASVGNGGPSSNVVEIDIAGATGANPPTVSGFGSEAALAGQIVTIQGSGFGNAPALTTVRIGDLEAQVVNVSGGQISALVPFGVIGGPVLVRTTQGETRSTNPLGIRTSVSGVVETTGRQPLSDVAVQLISLATGARVTTRTGANGAFVAADVPTGALFLRVQGSSLNAMPTLETISLPVTAGGNRDNPYQQTIFLQPVTGVSGQVGGGGFSGNGEETISLTLPTYAEPDETAQSGLRLQTGNAVFELPANAAVRFPDGSTSGAITLTQVASSRVPASFPAGVFSSTVIQLSPFGTRFNPGGKLTFPNPEGFAANSNVSLYRFNQDEDSLTLGQFVVVGEARVSGDGQRIETAANAIDLGGYYFAGRVWPVTTVTGRVLDANLTPLRRAFVNVRGQDAVTDGNGGFIIRNVPARSGEDLLTVEASILRATGRVDRAARTNIAPVINGLTTVRPDIVMPAADSNQAPVIFAPEAVAVPNGETTNIPVMASDPDNDQAVTFTVTGASFASLVKTDGTRNYNLRLAPTSVGDFTLTLIAVDGRGGRTTATVRVTIIQPNRAPVAADQTVFTNEDEAKTFTLNGTDADNNPLTWMVLTQPTKGKLTGTPPNLTYTPDANYFGRDSFTFKASDGKLESRVATLNLQIDSVNDAPVITVPGAQTVKEGELLSFTVSATDVDGDALTYSGLSLPTGANFLNNERRFVWTPNFDQAGEYMVSFAAFDNGNPPKSDVKSVRITVTGTNRPPVANAQDVTTDEDVAKTITLTGSDPDGNALTYMIVTPPTKGALSGTAPNLTYTPNKDANGADSFTFKVNDGTPGSAGDSAPATVRLTIRPVNDAPTATDQAVTTDEDVAKEITLAGRDIDGDRLTFMIVTPPKSGRLTGTPPLMTYTPNLDFNGTDNFTFKVNDGTVDSNVANVAITIRPVNDAPLARNKTYTTTEDTVVGALLDAVDAEGDAMTYTIVTQPTKGTLSGTAPVLIYTPNANFNGTDTFTYSASDGKLTGNVGTITLVVTPVNDAPVAQGQTVATNEDTPLNLTLGATDVDGDKLTFTLLTQPAKGKLTGTLPNLVYTPNKDENGADIFSFKVNDGTVDSGAAFVNITIRPVNDPPVARPQTVETEEDTPKAFILDASDVDGDKLTFTIVTQPTRGSLSGTAPILAYTPMPGVSGADSFTYRVSDGTVTTDPVRVNIEVADVNDPPILIVPNAQSIAEGQTLSFTVSAQDDGDPSKLKFTAPKLPTGANFIENQRLFTWTPNFDQAGTYTAGFNVDDNGTPPYNSYKEVTIIVTNTNRAPRANAQTVNATEDTAINFTLTGSDEDRDPITFMIVTPPGNGRVTGTAPNLTYTPNANFNGADTLTFKTNDGKLDSAFAVVSFNVASVNDAPILAVPEAQFLNESERLAFNLRVSDPDVGQTFTFAAAGLPTGAQLNAQTGAFVWTPTNKQAGNYKIDFTVTDNGTPPLSDMKALMITVTNPVPVARPMSVILDEDTSRAITLDVTDLDGDALVYTIVNAPQHGTLTGTAPNLTYTPALNYFGADQFTYKANDGAADSNIATVNLTINAVNDAPIVMVPGAQTANEGQLLSFTVTASDPDAGQTITLTATNLPEGAQFNQQTGAFTWTPGFAQAGNYTVNFTATDNGSPVRSDSKSVSLTINNVNRAPVANAGSLTTEEDTPKALVLAGSDPDGDTITYMLLTPPRNGALSGTPPSLTYTPNRDFNGSDSFTFQVKDAALESAFATIDITVTPINDAPALTVPGAQTINEDQLLTLTVSATDVDGPTPLRFSSPN